jgi:hypothetical protein
VAVVTPQTPTPRREPRTETGLRLLALDDFTTASLDEDEWRTVVLEIEEQAVTQAFSELEEAVGGLPVRDDINWADDEPIVPFVELRAVIDLIRKQGSPEEER